MLDTTVYNHMLNRELSFLELEEADYYCTQIQITELGGTNNFEKRIKLFKVFDETESGSIPIETFVLDTTPLGHSKIGPGSKYIEILETMNRIKKDKNNIKDSLIAETAYIQGMILVTGDKNLCKACKELGIPVKTLDEITRKN